MPSFASKLPWFPAALVLLTACALGSEPAFAGAKKAPPAKPASQYAAFETHPNEHVTIAADPCNRASDCSFFRLPYVAHGFVPVRVVIANDSDAALSLDDVRMQFISANGDKIPAATPEDLNRRLFTIRGTQPTRIPMIPIPIHHAPVDKKILQDDSDFGFRGTTVNAHDSLSGFLFYDIRELDDPALKHAELYVKMIHTLDGKHELFAFTIPFDKWLATQAPNNAKPTAPASEEKP